jgi:hypothetical protein
MKEREKLRRIASGDAAFFHQSLADTQTTLTVHKASGPRAGDPMLKYDTW